MRRALLVGALLCLAAAVAAPARAVVPVLPAEQWTAEARLKLAQALGGEAGWFRRYQWRNDRAVACSEGPDCLENRDWRIIPYVLLRRWQDLGSRCAREHGASCKPMTYAEVISAYCSPLKPHLATPTYEARVSGDPQKLRLVYRRRFIQAIQWDGGNLRELQTQYSARLDRDVSSTYYADGWAEIRSVVQQFGAGALADECPQAKHWDWHGSVPGDWLVRVDCGETLNVYSAPRGPGRRRPRHAE